MWRNPPASHYPRCEGHKSLVLYQCYISNVGALYEKLMPSCPPSNHPLFSSKGPVLLLHGLNISLLLGIAMTIAWSSQGSPVFGFAYLFTAMILFLKLISYAHVNRDLRLAWREVARSAKKKGGDDGEGPNMGLVGAATAAAGGRERVSWARNSSGDGFGGAGAGGRVSE